MVDILSKREYCEMFVRDDPNRFILTTSPWGTTILIDKEFTYYDTPASSAQPVRETGIKKV